jgi:hypothetical protein
MQAKTAVSQGDDLKILTQMTVVSHPFIYFHYITHHILQYVAFPLLFTTAFFSMSFANPPYPWAVFSGVLLVVSLANYTIASLASYMIASQSSPGQAFRDLWELFKKGWIVLTNWSRELWEQFKRWSIRLLTM